MKIPTSERTYASRGRTIRTPRDIHAAGTTSIYFGGELLDDIRVRAEQCDTTVSNLVRAAVVDYFGQHFWGKRARKKTDVSSKQDIAWCVGCDRPWADCTCVKKKEKGLRS